ncbi:hypothetical protein MMC16_004325 [Acarospora aff. strigata]|nr:hypothetical protein [Acarospora aff. strigata]
MDLISPAIRLWIRDTVSLSPSGTRYRRSELKNLLLSVEPQGAFDREYVRRVVNLLPLSSDGYVILADPTPIESNADTGGGESSNVGLPASRNAIAPVSTSSTNDKVSKDKGKEKAKTTNAESNADTGEGESSNVGLPASRSAIAPVSTSSTNDKVSKDKGKKKAKTTNAESNADTGEGESSNVGLPVSRSAIAPVSTSSTNDEVSDDKGKGKAKTTNAGLDHDISKSHHARQNQPPV